MKIVFDNYVMDSVLSSLHASLNYPVANLQEKTLKLRYQSVISSDTITVDLSELLPVSSFFYAYTNATWIQLRLYTGSDSLVYTLTIDNPESEIDAYHFNSVYADYAEIDIIGPQNVYLGGICLSESVEFPNPVNTWPENFKDNSLVTKNRNGGTLQDYIEPLRSYSFDIRDVTRYDSNFYKDLYRYTGIGAILWIDLFEDNHDYLMPIYCSLTEPFQPKKNGRRFDFTIAIEECR